MTLLLSKDHTVYYYEGMSDARNLPPIRHTNFDPAKGLRQIIMDQNKCVKDLQLAGTIPSGADACFLIKADTNSTYQDFVQVMDELNINDVKVKAVVDITPYDRTLIARH